MHLGEDTVQPRTMPSTVSDKFMSLSLPSCEQAALMIKSLVLTPDTAVLRILSFAWHKESLWTLENLVFKTSFLLCPWMHICTARMSVCVCVCVCVCELKAEH